MVISLEFYFFVSYFFTAEEACEVKNQAHGEKVLKELHKTITDG